MFWKINVLNSPIDTLLDKEGLTLKEILDEDDVLQECRAQNRKLIDFLILPDHFMELVKMVIDEPDADLDDKSKYKYPSISCEVLTSEVPEITEQLASKEELLNKVYGFLESEGPLNPLQASFFSKVMALLIARKSDVMLDFLKSKDDFVGHLLRHIGVSAIMDLLLRLVTCIQPVDSRLRCINWLNEEKLIQKLFNMINPSQAEEKHSNASQALCDMIVLSREHMSELQERADEDPLLDSIESKENISALLGYMLNSGELSESVLVNGLAVIQTLLEFRKVGPEGSCEKMTALDAERLANGVRNTIDAILPCLKDLKQVLLTPPIQHYSPMPTTIGPLNPPLGNSRLQIVHLIASLLLTNTDTVNRELCKIEILATIFDLYLKFTLNNFLHTQVESCVASILANPPCAVDNKEEHPLLEQLFRETKILHLVLDAFNSNEQEQSQPSGRRRGYMGHLIKMANYVNDQMENGYNSDRIKELVNGFSDDIKVEWDKFVAGSLAEVNKQSAPEKSGQFASTSDDDDFRDIPFPQDMGMHSFGFKEDEFAKQEEGPSPFSDRLQSGGVNFDFSENDPLAQSPQSEAMFEQACNTRMHEVDDEEDDMWENKDITFAKGNASTAAGKAKNDDDEDEWGFSEPVIKSSAGRPAANAATFAPTSLADAFSPASSAPGAPLSVAAAASPLSRPPQRFTTMVSGGGATPPEAHRATPAVPIKGKHEVEEADKDDPWETREITFSKPDASSGVKDAENDDPWETREITFAKPTASSGVSSTTRTAGQDSDSTDSDDDLDTPSHLRPTPKAEKMEVDAFDHFTNFALEDSSSQGAMEMDTSPWDSTSNNSNNQVQAEGWANFQAFDSPAPSEQPSAGFADFSSMEAASSEPCRDVEMEVKSSPDDGTAAAGDAVQADSTTKPAADVELPSSSEDPVVRPKEGASQDNNIEQASSSSDSREAAAAAVSQASEAAVDSNSNEAEAQDASSEAAAVCNNMPNDNQVLQEHEEDKNEDDLADNFAFLSRSGMMGGGGAAEEQVSSSGEDIDKLRAQAKEAMEEFSGATSSTTPDD